MDQEQLDHILEQHNQWWETEGERGRQADLSGADLSGLDLYNHHLNGAILRGTIFKGAMLEHVGINDADLRDADLRGAEYRQLYVIGSNLVGAKIDSPKLRIDLIDGEEFEYYDSLLNFNRMGIYDGRKAEGTIDMALALQFLLDYGPELISQLEIV